MLLLLPHHYPIDNNGSRIQLPPFVTYQQQAKAINESTSRSSTWGCRDPKHAQASPLCWCHLPVVPPLPPSIPYKRPLLETADLRERRHEEVVDLGKEAANLSVEGSLGCSTKTKVCPCSHPSLSTSRASALKLVLCLSLSPSLFTGMAAWTQRYSWRWVDGMEVWQCGGIDIEVRVEAKT